MRSLIALILAVSLVSVGASARADGPDEPKSPEPAPVAQPEPTPAPVAQPAPAAAVAQPTPATPSGPTYNAEGDEIIPNPSKKYGWAVGGAALGALVIGIALGGAAKARADEQNGDPNNPPLYTPELKRRGEEGEKMATTGYVFLGLGAVAAIVDAVIWYECLRKPRVVKKKVATGFGSLGVTF